MLRNPDVSFADIAQLAGVGRATLYRLYDNRDSLNEAVIQDCLDRFEKATQHIDTQARSIRHAFELLFDALLPLTEEYRFIAQLENRNDYPSALKPKVQKQKEEMLELIRLAKESGKINKKRPDEWLLNLIDAQVFAAQQTNAKNSHDQQISGKEICECWFKGVR